MIKIDCEQGSQEWFDVKLGVPSASNFDKIVTMKGEPSKQAQKYMYQLTAERVSGVREETFQSQAMTRGIEMEAEARGLYEIATGATVDLCGLCFKDEAKLFGASPDGLVGEDGCIEIKCPNAATHVGYLLGKKLPSEYFQQTQGQLLVTGRKWNDYVSYFPGLKPLIVRVVRDEVFLEALEKELNNFVTELNKLVNQIK